MNRISLIFVIITNCFFLQPLLAQKEQAITMGVYLNGSDFIHHQLSDTFSCNDHVPARIRSHELFGRYKLDIIKNGKKKVYFKDELYGYRDCHCHDYRFEGMNDYRIIDTLGFYLYSNSILMAEEKAAKLVVQYYFSILPSSPVLPLTIANLEKAFSQNNRFRYAIETSFRHDKQLMDYDPVLKEYKIKYLYMQCNR